MASVREVTLAGGDFSRYLSAILASSGPIRLRRAARGGVRSGKGREGGGHVYSEEGGEPPGVFEARRCRGCRCATFGKRRMWRRQQIWRKRHKVASDPGLLVTGRRREPRRVPSERYLELGGVERVRYIDPLVTSSDVTEAMALLLEQASQ